MIYKKQSLKSKVENLHSWLFSFIILMIVVNASVKAQDLDDRSRFKTVTTLDATRNDTIVISQIQMDSIGCDAFCSSTGLHSIFSFLKENIDYQSKAVEMDTFAARRRRFQSGLHPCRPYSQALSARFPSTCGK